MATTASPVEVLKPSAEKTNFIRLARLLMRGGTAIVRGVFDSIIPPSRLPKKLDEPAVFTRLHQMKKDKILFSSQWKVLFPSSSTYGKSESFDITLLFKLLREFCICGLPAPSKGWDDSPDDKDLSLSADLARIKYYRNKLCPDAAKEDLRISDGDFKIYRKQIKDVLLRLQAVPSLRLSIDWEDEIDKLLTGPITNEDERNIEELKSWCLQDMGVEAMPQHVQLPESAIVERLAEEQFMLRRKDRGNYDTIVERLGEKQFMLRQKDRDDYALGKSLAMRTTKEFVNFARLMRLTIDCGTKVLREVFDSIHSPSTLRTTLLSPSVRSNLGFLRSKKILTFRHWNTLYPVSKKTPVTSADFNISLLYTLFRNVCSLRPPSTGWDNPPKAEDLSREADLVRIKNYRNELYIHITETAVSDSDFEKYWSKISDVLVRLGGPQYKPVIEKMEIERLDPEDAIDKRESQGIIGTREDRPTHLSSDIETSVDEMGCSHDFSRKGIFLHFPPNAVTKRTVVTCNDRSKDYSPSPADADEYLVSNIVELGPDDVDIRQPITVSLMHSGPGRDLGYETVVRAFNKDKGVWAKIEEFKDKSHLPKHWECDYIQVQISKLTALAVVTRLITDRFHATPKGCVVRSSVCHDITVEFPEGAVEKAVEGTMKLMLMPENIHHTKDACPIICIDVFSKITFSKPVIVKMPIPNNEEEYSAKEIRLLRLIEDSKWEDNEWKDVTHQVHISKSKTHIEFHVERFSRLWLWLSKKKIKFAPTIFRYLRSPPRAVCFAAFKDNEEASLSLSKLTLVCVANHKQKETLSDMRGDGYSRLAVATGDRKMRADDRAYPSVNGAEMKTERFFLKFLGKQICRKELSVCDTAQDEENLEQVVIDFFPNREENLDLRLGTLQMNKEMVFSGSGGERQRILTDQQQVEEEAQPLEGAVAPPPLSSSESEEEDRGILDLVLDFSQASLVTLSAEEVATRLPQYLGVDRTSIADPSPDIMQKCRQFCRWLKNNGRKDVVEALRNKLPSGMTGPLLDGNILVKNLDQVTKLRLSRALTVTDRWQTFAENIDGITHIDIKFYEERKDNPVLEILKEHCANMKIDTLYRCIVESGANAIADHL